MSRSDGAKGRLLAAAAALVLADALWLQAGGATAADDGFARASGGLGLGAASSPEWSLFGVDARLESACEAERFPLPGLACPDPGHGAGVFAARSRR